MIDPSKIQTAVLSHPKEGKVQVSAGVSLFARAFVDFLAIEQAVKGFDPVERTKMDVREAVWNSIYGSIREQVIESRNDIIQNHQNSLNKAADELGELIEQLTFRAMPNDSQITPIGAGS